MFLFIKYIFASDKSRSNYVHKRGYEPYMVLRTLCKFYFTVSGSYTSALLHFPLLSLKDNKQRYTVNSCAVLFRLLMRFVTFTKRVSMTESLFFLCNLQLSSSKSLFFSVGSFFQLND
jgi:hypothetical protein